MELGLSHGFHGRLDGASWEVGRGRAESAVLGTGFHSLGGSAAGQGLSISPSLHCAGTVTTTWQSVNSHC